MDRGGEGGGDDEGVAEAPATRNRPGGGPAACLGGGLAACAEGPGAMDRGGSHRDPAGPGGGLAACAEGPWDICLLERPVACEAQWGIKIAAGAWV